MLIGGGGVGAGGFGVPGFGLPLPPLVPVFPLLGLTGPLFDSGPPPAWATFVPVLAAGGPLWLALVWCAPEEVLVLVLCDGGLVCLVLVVEVVGEGQGQ
jgi:hypothetical protein